MAMPEAVNAQITDAITQTNIRPADGAGTARGNLYLATAHAMGIAAENAVSNQQQQNILQMAATTQGIMQIYSLDTANDAGANGDTFASTVQEQRNNLTADTAAKSIDQALDAVGKAVPKGDSAWPAELREVMHAVADSLQALQTVANENCLTAIKQAAITAVLARGIKAPEQWEQYEKILAAIKAL